MPKKKKQQQKTKTHRNFSKIIQVTRRRNVYLEPRRALFTALHKPAWTVPLPSNQDKLHPTARAPTPPHSSLTPQTHLCRRLSIAQHQRVATLRATFAQPRRALTGRQSGDSRNLACDLCSEHREVLLVAFEVGRHGGFGVIGPGRSLGQGRESRGVGEHSVKTLGTALESRAEPRTALSPAASWLSYTISVLRKLDRVRFSFREGFEIIKITKEKHFN